MNNVEKVKNVKRQNYDTWCGHEYFEDYIDFCIGDFLLGYFSSHRDASEAKQKPLLDFRRVNRKSVYIVDAINPDVVCTDKSVYEAFLKAGSLYDAQLNEETMLITFDYLRQDEVIKNVEATLAFEELFPSDQAISACIKMTNEEELSAFAVETILELYNLKTIQYKAVSKIRTNGQSIYNYPGTYTCINHFNIKCADELARVEADLTCVRLTELAIGKVKGGFDVPHMKRIHKQIFKDLYPFAGKFREENIWKGEMFFCKSEFINENLIDILGALKNENLLMDCSFEALIDRLAYYMSELNMIHPFREGNGRSLREFIRQLALKNGYELNWYTLDPEKILAAIIATSKNDFVLLKACLKIALNKV